MLDFKDNSFIGDIFDKLCNFKDLKYLDFFYNYFDIGNIFDCIVNGGFVINVNYGYQSNDSGDSSGGSGGNGSSSSGNGGNGGNGGSVGEGFNEVGLLVQFKVVMFFLFIFCVVVF